MKTSSDVNAVLPKRSELAEQQRKESKGRRGRKGREGRKGDKGRAGRKGLVLNVILWVLAMVAVSALLYPTASNWFEDRRHNSEISGYLSSVADTSPQERTHKLDVAYLYNDELEPGPLIDPYTAADPEAMKETPLYKAYLEVLRVTGSDAIGTITYPRLGIGLPIYHGTSDAVIRKGVGHMYGSSMPVGGPGTHSLLTAHSGLPNAKLFTKLPDAKVGDEFRINVLDEDHYYVVRDIVTVAPDGVDFLEIVEGEDWVTLFTCVPIGVNSHRILVQAERTEGPSSESSRRALDGDGVEVGFPWWAVIWGAAAIGLGWFLLVPPRKKRKDDSEEAG